MAIATILEHPGQSQAQAEQIQAHVRSTGPVPPEGARLVLGGPANPGWRVVTVWDSVDARERFFAERLTPAFEQAGLSFADTKRTQFDVQMLTAGDLTGPRNSPEPVSARRTPAHKRASNEPNVRARHTARSPRRSSS